MKRSDFDCMEQFNFDFAGTWLENVGGKLIHHYAQNLYIDILKQEERAIKDKIVEWCKEYAQEHAKNIRVILMDEEIVKEIVDLGIDAYIRKRKD